MEGRSVSSSQECSIGRSAFCERVDDLRRRKRGIWLNRQASSLSFARPAHLLEALVVDIVCAPRRNLLSRELLAKLSDRATLASTDLFAGRRCLRWAYLHATETKDTDSRKAAQLKSCKMGESKKLYARSEAQASTWG